MSNLLIRRLSTLVLVIAGVAGVLAPAASLFAQDASKDDGKKKDPDLAASVNPDDPTAAKIYIIPVTGEVGRDFAAMPLREVMKDAKKVQPDYIVLYINTTWKDFKGRDKQMYNPQDASGAFDTVDKVHDIGLLLTDEIRDDKEWVKKPQMISWVKNALGPSAFIPFMTPKIFYTSDALHGGIGYLDYLFAGVGDLVVQRKQQSLRMGRAEGVAIKGGHNPQILRAMAWVDYSLSYTLVGGKPVFFENITDGENVLTDDGDAEAGRADSVDDMLRYKGNDVLTLTTPVAKRISFIDGEANSTEDLAYELGVNRAYHIYRERASKIIGQWQKDSANRRAEFMRLRDEARRIQVNGETTTERNAQRGRIKRNLLTMVEMLTKYRDSLFGMGSDPDTVADQIRQRIAQIDQDIRLDRDVPRGGRPGGR